ncbi:DNA replication complex GINS family protein [Methanobacterium aggregans]|uniref:DNA replication complex GINS family protein n=1 Tax=Methanobacterium aggregans TaxID=1615586 RepID=UPI001AE6A9A4|nr:DNA replication complex GINS family protein [Methanobacterium aggregans]MBP2045843.1 DNA replication factor GINS [Methanobacterium aggregans]
MDEFFQRLREIQKKERSVSGLSSVGDSFYTDVSNYLNALMRKIDDNPFSFESYLLRDAQRIVEEICERREHKIANSAVMNVQRAHQLFKESKGKKSRIKKENPITVPVNSTPEEENLYFEIVDSLVKYRARMTEPLRSYLHKNQEKSFGGQGEDHGESSQDLGSAGAGGLEKIGELDTALPEDSVNEGLASESGSRRKSKKSVKGFGDEAASGFEDQIYEIYGSEPSKQASGNNDLKGADLGGSKQRTSETRDALNSDEGAVGSSAVSDHGNSITVGMNEPSDKLKSDNSVENGPIKTLLILDELPSILGVDKNVYGPVIPQDIVTLPEANAKILIKNRKGMAIQRYK